MWIIASLIILGILFLLIELLLTPGVGICGILGILSLGGGCYYSFHSLGTAEGLWITAGVLALIVISIIWVLRSGTWKKFELKDEITTTVEDDSVKVSTGDRGTTVTRLAPMGTAEFNGVRMEVCSSDGLMVDPRTEVEVVSSEKGKINVKPIN